MKTVVTVNGGFVYDTETMEVVSDFTADVTVSTPDSNEFFYGTREEAIEFGIKFKDE